MSKISDIESNVYHRMSIAYLRLSEVLADLMNSSFDMIGEMDKYTLEITKKKLIEIEEKFSNIVANCNYSNEYLYDKIQKLKAECDEVYANKK